MSNLSEMFIRVLAKKNSDLLCINAQWKPMKFYGICKQENEQESWDLYFFHNEILKTSKNYNILLHITLSSMTSSETLQKLSERPKLPVSIRARIAIHPNCDPVLRAQLLSDKAAQKRFSEIIANELIETDLYSSYLAHIKSLVK